MRLRLTYRAARTTAVAAAMGAALYGCAVMTIDVDVYKGPLANHKDVQTEQIAVMAVGARPLLERLKSNLCEKVRSDGGFTNSNAEICRDQYGRIAAIPVSFTENTSVRAKKDSEHLLENVEATLSLYSDLSEIDPKAIFRRLLREAGDNLERTSEAFNDFQLLPSFNAERSIIGKLKDISESAGPAKSLALAYHSYLAAKPNNGRLFRNWRAITKELERLQADDVGWPAMTADMRSAIRRDINMVLEGVREVIRPGRDGDGEMPSWANVSSNKFFEVWSRDDVLRRQASLLFQGADDQDAFIRVVARTARGFTEARQHTEELLVTAVVGLRELGVFRNAARTSKTSARDLSALEQATVELSKQIASLIQRSHLLLALRYETPLQRTLATPLTGLVNPFMPREQISREAWQVLDRTLVHVLTQDPISGANALLDAHYWFKSKNYDLKIARSRFDGRISVEDSDRIEDRFAGYATRRKFGLVQGPAALNSGTLEDFNETLSGLGEIGIDVSFDWHRGRIEPGLFALIEDFLEKSRKRTIASCGENPCVNPGAQADAARRLLHDALIRFAQKVLFVVNHESLFQTTSSVYRSNGTGDDDGWNGGVSDDAQTDTYVRVLQTVGNSILVHIDAMRNEETHEKALVGAKDRELAAASQLFGDGPEQAFDQLIRALSVQVQTARREIATLKKAHATARTELASAKKAETAVCSFPATLPLAPTQVQRDALKQYEGMLEAVGLAGDAGNANAKVKSAVDALRKVKTPVAHDVIPNAIEKALDTAIKEATVVSNGDLLSRLMLVKATYSTARPSLTPGSGTKLAEEFEKEMQGKALSELVKLKKPIVLYDTAVAKRKSLQNACAAAKAVVAEKNKRENTFGATIQDLQQAVLELLTSRPVFAAHRSVAVAKANAVKTVSPNAGKYRSSGGLLVRQALSEVLEESKTDANKTASNAIAEAKRQKRLDTAIAIVGSLPPALSIPGAQLAADKNANARDVLDSLIAVLRYEHLDAARSGKADLIEELHTTKALAEAYRQRGDMIYIRPAVAYLRTSFAATTLQGNDVAWKNMLQRQGLQSGFPLFPDLFSAHDTENKIINEIDKQFWQTINRVRVAGSGTTNYAIAKDDVGNWYVKNYSTNVRKIAESARKLAFFAGGGFVTPPSSTPLTGAPGSASAPGVAPTAAQPKDPAEASALGKTFRKFEASYRAETLAAIKALRDEAKGYPTRIEAEWASGGVAPDDVDKLKSAVAIVDGSDLKKLTDQDDETIDGITKGTESGALAGALRAVSSYYATALTKIDNANADKPKAAKRILAQVVLENTLKKRIAAAKGAVGKFENAIGVMGQF